MLYVSASDNECGILQRGISLEEELKCDSPDLGDVRSPGTSSGFGVEREKSESPINESLSKEEPRNKNVMLKAIP